MVCIFNLKWSKTFMILLLACAPSKFFSFYRVEDHQKCIMQRAQVNVHIKCRKRYLEGFDLRSAKPNRPQICLVTFLLLKNCNHSKTLQLHSPYKAKNPSCRPCNSNFLNSNIITYLPLWCRCFHFQSPVRCVGAPDSNINWLIRRFTNSALALWTVEY